MSIHLNKVHYAYPETPEKPVLDIKHWSVEANEQVFLHGPSGSGKSTLLSILSGMLTSSDGEVSVLGERLDKMSKRQRDRFRANHIGYVFQQFNLIPYLDAINNIQLARYFAHTKKKKISETDISDLLCALNIAASDWSKSVSKLSIGQQQRIAIARALINKPELLIADEPTSSLDQNNRDSFMSLLMDLSKQHNITLVFVSHDMSLSAYFSRIESLSEINQARPV